MSISQVNREVPLNGASRVKAFTFLCGIVTKANGIFLAINQDWFKLDYTMTMLAPLFFFFASVFIAPFAGASLYRFGYKPGMITGIFFCIFSTLCMFLSHFMKIYPLFLGGIFILGIGVKFLLVAGPSFSVLLGPKETQSGRISMMQAFYSIGALLAPGLFWFLLGSDYFQAGSVVSFSYLAFFLLWVVVVMALWGVKGMPPKYNGAPREENGIFPKLTKTLFWSFIAMCLYMGVEVSVDSLLVKFLTSNDGGALSLGAALSCFSLYYLGFTIGRLCGFWILNRYSLPIILMSHAAVAAITFGLAIWFSGSMVIAAAVILGFCNSYLYPLILAIGVKEESSAHSKVIGFLSTGAIGGALLPLVQGMLADSFGLRISFLLPFLCYFGLFFYARFMRKHQLAKITPNLSAPQEA